MINFKQLKQMVIGRSLEFRREPSAIFWVGFMPVLWMVGLGLAFSNPTPEQYRVGLITVAGQVLDKEITSPQIKWQPMNVDDIIDSIKRDKIDIALAYSESGVSKYYYDEKSPFAGRAKLFVNELIQKHRGQKDMFPTITKSITAKGARYIDFLIPGLLALSVMTSSLFGTGMTIVSNRRDNLLKRYIVTPMLQSHFILSHVIGRLMVLSFEFFIILFVGALLFGFGSFSQILPMFLMSCAGAACFTTLALLVGSRTKNVAAMGGMINLIMFPMMMLSGVFFSTKNFPEYLKAVVDWMPLTFLCDGLRTVSHLGVSFTEVLPQIACLLLFAVLFGVLARIRFRWY